MEVEGSVLLILPDDEDNGHQQQFLIEMESGQRIKVLHDLDAARRAPVKKASLVRIKGESDWDAGGGTVHWTHRDVSGQRDGGWIELDGRRY